MSDEQTDGCHQYHQWIEELAQVQTDEKLGSLRRQTDEMEQKVGSACCG